ncbi:MAG: TraR/DksA C4-type zinc finger protein [Polyangia bacterium]
MKKRDTKRFEKILREKREKILINAQQTLASEMQLDQADLPDEMDLASSEYLQSFQFRLRGRERTFLSKIDKALAKIEEGTFGECESCGEPIHLKRLEARPETTLCIKCKEEQEREEQQFGD